MKEYRAEIVMTVNFYVSEEMIENYTEMCGDKEEALKQLALEHLDTEGSYPRGFNFLVCLDTDEEYEVNE